MAEVKTLRGLIPMCAWCKKIRDDKNCWHTLEAYLTERIEARISHGMCPACYEKAVATELRRPAELDYAV